MRDTRGTDDDNHHDTMHRSPSGAGRSGVVLGDDWVSPQQAVPQELRARRARRSLFSLRSSPLTRKIIIFNLIALIILVSGILYLNSSRQSLVMQRLGTLVSEAMLTSDVFEAKLPASPDQSLAGDNGTALAATLGDLSLRAGAEVFVFDTAGALLGHEKGVTRTDAFGRLTDSSQQQGRTLISDALGALWSLVGGQGAQGTAAREMISVPATQFGDLVSAALAQSAPQAAVVLDSNGGTVYAAAAPVLSDGGAGAGGTGVGVVVMTSPTGEIDALVRAERERVLQMFVIALLVSVGLSLVLASTIANPLADLAEAAELGRDRDSSNVRAGRVRIPDLSARPDEIGRLSRALRGMVKALYYRIDSNEQFAADVAHEIKNPLASLQSAVGTLRMVHRDDQREKLMEVIEHDVRRLDRLVSDISNASRLDAELVKEEEEEFDLLNMLRNINQYLGEDARAQGIDYITELPEDPIRINGLEARLAQVFVNLISNAISFCEEGDAIRVWARQRDNRVLVVVEDTGPGIPDQALSKIFKRFYSQRPDEHFGNNSGLGLAISKQIVEAHGGVIWAENIRPTEADVTSEPLGARFVVGLPV